MCICVASFIIVCCDSLPCLNRRWWAWSWPSVNQIHTGTWRPPVVDVSCHGCALIISILPRNAVTTASRSGSYYSFPACFTFDFHLCCLFICFAGMNDALMTDSCQNTPGCLFLCTVSGSPNEGNITADSLSECSRCVHRPSAAELRNSSSCLLLLPGMLGACFLAFATCIGCGAEDTTSSISAMTWPVDSQLFVNCLDHFWTVWREIWYGHGCWPDDEFWWSLAQPHVSKRSRLLFSPKAGPWSAEL